MRIRSLRNNLAHGHSRLLFVHKNVQKIMKKIVSGSGPYPVLILPKRMLFVDPTETHIGMILLIEIHEKYFLYSYK